MGANIFCVACQLLQRGDPSPECASTPPGAWGGLHILVRRDGAWRHHRLLGWKLEVAEQVTESERHVAEIRRLFPCVTCSRSGDRLPASRGREQADVALPLLWSKAR